MLLLKDMKNNFFFLFCFLILLSAVQPNALLAGEQEDWDFANGLYVREIYDLAQKEYRRFIDSYPASSFINDAYYRIAESFWHLKKYEDALPFYQKLKREDLSGPKKEVIRLREALCYKNAGESEKAGSLLRGFEKEFPSSHFLSTVFYLLAQMADSQESISEALIYYDRAIEKEDKNKRLALYRKGHLLIRMERFDEATKAFAALLETKKKDQIYKDALLKTGELYFQLKQFERACFFYKSFLKEYPDSELALEAYRSVFYALSSLKNLEEMERFFNAHKATKHFADEQDFSFFLMAKTAFEKALYEKAKVFLHDLRSKDAKNRYLVRSIILEARIAFVNGKYNEAFNILGDVQGQELAKEDLCEIYFIKAQSLKKIGHIQEASEFFEKIIHVQCHQPILTKAYFEKADCHSRLGQYEEASLTMRSFIDGMKDIAYMDKAYLKLAEYLSYSGNLLEAVEKLKEFIQNYPESASLPDAYYRISINYMKMGKFAEMAQSLDDLVTLFPENRQYHPKGLYWLGWNSLRNKDFEEARKKLEIITNTYRDSDIFFDAVYWLGVACQSMGNGDEALYYFIELLESGEKRVFSQTILFWLTDELIKNNDLTHAETAASWLKEKVETSQSVERADYLELSIAYGKEDFSKALKLIDQFLEKYPSSLLVHEAELKKIGALIESEKYDLADKKIEKLAEADDVDIAFRSNFMKARLFEKKNAKEDAAREYLRLAILYDHPLSPEAALRAYDLFNELGQADAAEKSRKEILERWPESPPAKRFKND